jgi:hypothetical protein
MKAYYYIKRVRRGPGFRFLYFVGRSEHSLEEVTRDEFKHGRKLLAGLGVDLINLTGSHFDAAPTV